MPDQLLTAEELGALLRLQPDTIISWARRGGIPACRLSRKVIRFRLADVMVALDTAEPGTTGQSSEAAP